MLTPQLFELANQRLAQFDTSNLNTQQQESLSQAIALSDFILEQLLKSPQWIAEVLDAANQSDRQLKYDQMLNEQLAKVSDEDDFHRRLRQFRNRETVIIAWRDLLSISDVKKSLQQISLLAETLIMQAYYWHFF